MNIHSSHCIENSEWTMENWWMNGGERHWTRRKQRVTVPIRIAMKFILPGAGVHTKYIQSGKESGRHWPNEANTIVNSKMLSAPGLTLPLSIQMKWFHLQLWSHGQHRFGFYYTDLVL